MREIHVDEIAKLVAPLTYQANYYLGEDVLNSLKEGLEKEISPAGKDIFRQLIKNAEIARDEQMPICQDCGLAVYFVELGVDVHIVGGTLRDALEQATRVGYKEGYLRKSTCDPFTRKNIGDNTPSIIHLEQVPGDKIKIIFAPKGGGSENMSRVTMLAPSQGIEGVKKFVVNRVSEAGANPCPPIVVGIGVGGTFERSAYLAKKALIREFGQRNPEERFANFEREVWEECNKLGIGPQGLGGRFTVLEVFMEVEPCHIASLPCAVNINCHATRHKEILI